MPSVKHVLRSRYAAECIELVACRILVIEPPLINRRQTTPHSNLNLSLHLKFRQTSIPEKYVTNTQCVFSEIFYSIIMNIEQQVPTY